MRHRQSTPSEGLALAEAPHSESARKDLDENYQLYRLELRRFFGLNARDPHAADDLIQTLYLSMKKRTSHAGASAEDVRDPRRYLFRMAWNVLHSENRRLRAERAHKAPYDIEEVETLADRSNLLWVEDDTSFRAQRAELDRALSQLPRACQIAVLRQYRDNKSYKEIAAELGVTTHTVKKYISRALQHFRVQLDVKSLGLGR